MTEPTPRLAPAEFEKRDLVRHTWTTWIVFSVGFVLWYGGGQLVSGRTGPGLDMLVIFSLIAVISALALVWIGAPLAWLVGRALRHVDSVAVHLLSFAALGAVGCFVLLAIFLWEQPEALFAIATLLSCLGCAACAGIGRFVAFRLRRRDDARRIGVPQTA